MLPYGIIRPQWVKHIFSDVAPMKYHSSWQVSQSQLTGTVSFFGWESILKQCYGGPHIPWCGQVHRGLGHNTQPWVSPDWDHNGVVANCTTDTLTTLLPSWHPANCWITWKVFLFQTLPTNTCCWVGDTDDIVTRLVRITNAAKYVLRYLHTVTVI